MATNRAIILAAGASERLGMHKALVDVGGMTLVELVGEKLQQANPVSYTHLTLPTICSV